MWTRSAAYAFPVALCFVVHWYGLTAWFQQDDFAWLGMSGLLRDYGPEYAFFTPFAQGTVRLFSERLFFFTFYELFGLEALPYRLVVFTTQALNLVLLTRIGEKLSGRLLTGVAAASLWGVHGSLSWPLAWTAAYNQILLATCFLGALHFLIRYSETGRTRDNAAQWAIHLFGYGVLEANVMYPLVAIAYAAIFARHCLKSTFWLLAPAAAYTGTHFLFIAKQSGGTYGLQPWAAPTVFGEYLLLASWPNEIIGTAHYVAAGVLVAYALWRAARRDWVAIFGAAWFFITVAPYLALPGHVSDYYLAVPAIGLSLLLATPRVPVLAAILTLASIPVTWERSGYYNAASLKARDAVLGIAQVAKAHPGRTILLAGVDDELFRNAVYDHAFRLAGAPDVYLTPENTRQLTPPTSLKDFSGYTLPPAEVKDLLETEKAVVYLLDYGRIRNVTQAYRAGRLYAAIP